MPERNLVIVHTPGRQALSDFLGVKQRIADRAPDIETFIVRNGLPNSVSRRQAARRPSIIYSPYPRRGFEPTRGTRFDSLRYSKIEETRRLTIAGLPTPPAVVIEPDTMLDPATWGPLTVVKPNSETEQGRGVSLMRTDDVRWIDTSALPRTDMRHGRKLIAQQFIDTGRYAASHRVMVVFGRAIYSVTSQAATARPPIDQTKPLDVPIASNSGERSLTLNFDEDIIDLARRAYDAFPELPLLGVDVIREEATGRLFILEVNSGLGCWHISSGYFAPYLRKFGLDLHAQFGAINVIAEALIDATRREAA